MTASAEALAGLPIKPPGLRPPRPIPIQIVPSEQYASALKQARTAQSLYGRVTPAEQRYLNTLRHDAIDELHHGIDRVIARTDNPSVVRQARAVLWSCAGDAVRSTASGVGTAIAGGTPDAQETYLQAAQDCLRGRFSESGSDINRVAAYLLNLIAGYAEEAGNVVDATPAQQVATQQLWLEATAAAISNRDPTPAPAQDRHDPRTPAPTSSSPTMPFLLGGATLALAVGLVVARRRRLRT